MKKIILLLIIISTLTFGETQITQKIAVVDMGMVLEQYTKRAQLEKDLEAQKKGYDKELNQQKEALLKKELEVVKNGDRPTEEDYSQLKDLKGGIEKNYREFDTNLNKMYNDYMFQLNSDIVTATVVVGKEMRFDIVFHKGTTFYGGTDITEEVIDFLNKGEKIPLGTKEMKGINNDLNRYKN